MRWEGGGEPEEAGKQPLCGVLSSWLLRANGSPGLLNASVRTEI